MERPKQEGLKVQIVRYTLDKGFAEYQIRVSGSGDSYFHIRDRYSGLRSFYSIMRKQFSA